MIVVTAETCAVPPTAPVVVLLKTLTGTVIDVDVLNVLVIMSIS